MRVVLPDPDPDFLPIPDPGVKCGSGFATLQKDVGSLSPLNLAIPYRLHSGATFFKNVLAL